MDRYMDK